jgi:hypothetical protein
MKGQVLDTSSWFSKSGNRAKGYYNFALLLATYNIILFEDFDLLKEEDDFTQEIVLPIFNEIKRDFGIKPIIVKISNVGEHEKDPYWWCYSKEAKEIMDNHIKTLKC